MLSKILSLLIFSLLFFGCSPTTKVVRDVSNKKISKEKIDFAHIDAKKIVRQAVDLYNKGKFKLAALEYQKAAQMGQMVAQNNLGFMHFEGKALLKI